MPWFFEDGSCSDTPYSSLHSFSKYTLNSCSGLGKVVDTSGDMKMNQTPSYLKRKLKPHLITVLMDLFSTFTGLAAAPIEETALIKAF